MDPITPTPTSTPTPPAQTPPATLPPSTPPAAPEAPATMPESFRSRLRGGAPPAPAPDATVTPEDSSQTPNPDESPKVEKPAAKAKADAAPDGDPAAAPKKKVIRRAAGYDVPPAAPQSDPAIAKLADATSRLVEKIASDKKEPELKLTKQEQRQIEVFEIMGQSDARYANLAANAKRLISELPAYEEKWSKSLRESWEKEHKEEFDTDRERETAFNEYRNDEWQAELERQNAKYGVEYESADFEDAAVARQTKPLVEKLTKAERELEEMRAGKAVQDILPAAKEMSVRAVQDFSVQLASVDEAFAGILNEDGTMNSDKMDALPDPEIVGPVVEDAATRARNFAEWTTRAFAGDTFKVKGTKEQQELEFGKLSSVADFCMSQEQAIMEGAPEQQVDEKGRSFLPAAEFFKLAPAEQRKHWTLNAEIVIARANDAILASAQKKIEGERARINKILERRGYKLGDVRTKVTPDAAPAPAATPKAPNVKPQSPTSTDGTPVGEPAKGGGTSYMQNRFKQSVISGLVA